MAKRATAAPPAPATPKLPERLCPQHAVLMEPVGALNDADWYYCPTGGAVRPWRPIFKPRTA